MTKNNAILFQSEKTPNMRKNILNHLKGFSVLATEALIIFFAYQLAPCVIKTLFLIGALSLVCHGITKWYLFANGRLDSLSEPVSFKLIAPYAFGLVVMAFSIAYPTASKILLQM